MALVMDNCPKNKNKNILDYLSNNNIHTIFTTPTTPQ